MHVGYDKQRVKVCPNAGIIQCTLNINECCCVWKLNRGDTKRGIDESALCPINTSLTPPQCDEP